jgi:hypothetical protein
MNLMAAGLAGHEHDFYRFVTESSWLGGDNDYSALREGFPYWFNALVSLAYGLDDDTLKDQVRQSADYVLDNQAEDGWIGPEEGAARNVWGRVPVIMGLVGMAEADPDYSSKVEDALYRFSGLLNQMLNNDFQGYKYHDGDEVSEDDTIWGRVRYQDLLLSLQWLAEKAPREQSDMDTLFDNMNLLLTGGLDWADWFSADVFIKEDLNMINPPIETDHPLWGYTHNVNMAQGLKATSVVWRFTHNTSLPGNARQGVTLSFDYHTAPSGAILGDERLAGLAPYYGSELCGVVEEMFSLTTMRNTLGDASFADRAELVAFNALPAMLTPDWWAHQYVSQPNQAYSHHLTDPGTDNEDTPFWNVNAWGQTFGLEPDFPCCTVNHPQGFPKFLAAVYTLAGDNGIAQSLLAPASASVTLGDSTVDIDCETNYPFDNTLSYTIKSDKAFTFHVRVPGWASTADSTITTTTAAAKGKGQAKSKKAMTVDPDVHTGLVPIAIEAGTTQITYKLATGSAIHVENRANDTVAIHAQGLLYTLAIDATNTTSAPKSYDSQTPIDNVPAQSLDWTFDNTTAWAVAIDPASLQYTQGDSAAPLADPIFAPGAPPGYIEVRGCEIDWPLYHAVPDSPPLAENRACKGDAATYRMVPYGSAKIRMTELPTISLSG